MKNYFTKFSLLFASMLLAVSCSKDISVGEGQDVETRNFSLSTIFTYEGDALSADSLYEDASGNLYVIDQVTMVISDFYVESRGELFTDTTAFAVFNFDRRTAPMLKLSPGSYSGEYGFTVGLSESNNSKDPSDFPESSGMRDPSIYRGPIGTYSGYNFLTISGRTFDPSLPDTVAPGVPTVPFLYELGDTLRYLASRGKSFTISNDQRADFDFVLDVAHLMRPFDVVATESIESRPNSPSDYNNAILLQQQLDSALVLF